MDERNMVRALAEQYTEIAFSDESKAKAQNWGRLNALDPSARPPIILDQLPWNEFEGLDELKCLSSDPLLREIEGYFRTELFRVRREERDPRRLRSPRREPRENGVFVRPAGNPLSVPIAYL